MPERGFDARAALVVCLVAALSIALAGILLWRSRPQSADVGPVPAAAVVGSVPGTFTAAAVLPTPAPTQAPTGSPVPEDPGIVVDVQGKVRRPGVVNLPSGARVRDALNAVGGPRSGVSTTVLNLAAPLADGEQIVLGPDCAAPAVAPPPAPTVAAAPARAAAPRSAPAAASRPVQSVPALIDLNRATTAELETLPGVGPVLAQRIVDYRTTRGRFTAIDELREISGIGPAKFAEIRARVKV